MNSKITFEEIPNALSQLITLTNQVLNRVSRLDMQQISKPLIPVGVEQACKILGKSKHTIYKLCHNRELKHMKKGGKLYFYESELLEYINSGKRKTDIDIEHDVNLILKRK